MFVSYAIRFSCFSDEKMKSLSRQPKKKPYLGYFAIGSKINDCRAPYITANGRNIFFAILKVISIT